MTKTVIILNSPPHSGKDTLANLMVKTLNATKQEFKKYLYEETAKYYIWPREDLKRICTSRNYKDNLCSQFSKKHKVTPRAALIYVSEVHIKPNKGADYLGERAADELAEGLNVFSDGGGWWDELLPVVQASDKVIICRLYRDGFNFNGDSRQYYDLTTTPPVKGIRISDIHLEENKPNMAIDAIAQLLKG